MEELTKSGQVQHVIVSTMKVDDLGRVVIPKDIRCKLGILGGTLVDLRYDGQTLILQKSQTSAPLMDELDRLSGQIELLGKGSNGDAEAARQLETYLEGMRCIVEEHLPQD